jgi:hypothetical protein
MIENILKAVKVFQDKYPDAHVGGSIGLTLHGIDLKRDLSKSDIDITVYNKLPDIIDIANVEISSNPEDFDYAFRYYPDSGSRYIKLDIRYCPEPSFEVIEYEGVKYNVSKKVDILYWKQKYADKQVQKHVDDLIAIKTGIRPEPQPYMGPSLRADDFPF